MFTVSTGELVSDVQLYAFAKVVNPLMSSSRGLSLIPGPLAVSVVRDCTAHTHASSDLHIAPTLLAWR